ncbi:MAG: exo-beta-N-acetylmuramidase NamZ domain-containing protein [Chloroflexota bacterium]
MKKYIFAALAIIAVCLLFSSFAEKDPVPGAAQYDAYKGLIKGKSIAVLANQTSMAGSEHLVDMLLGKGENIKVIFAPEHGFRDLADAGATIDSGKDIRTGISIISLYGKHNKPTPEDLAGVDVAIFDIQDVGTRFYTYISTLQYLLEACAENNLTCIVLDRPNPNGFYVDGNILDTAYTSFVGMNPIPVVHGMTVGEYAQMLNGEGWLKGGVKCDLRVVKCRNYNHKTMYELPVKPSPNLPNQNSIYLYPSTCFFEGTHLSVGRGTPTPFQVFGSPEMPDRGFSFTPESVPGATNPPFLGKRCFGTDLSKAMENGIVPSPKINLEWIIAAYNDYPVKEEFFTSYFDVLAGGPVLREQIQNGMNAEKIRETWQKGLKDFEKIRVKYLLYK